MAFPLNPVNGDTYVRYGRTYVYVAARNVWEVVYTTASSGSSLSVSETPPIDPSPGDQWLNSSNMRVYVYYDDGDSQQWTSVNTSGADGADGADGIDGVDGATINGVTVYPTVETLPLSNNQSGDQAFVSSTNRLYIWNGTGWYNIALINTSPSITGGNQSSYFLETNGTPLEITLVGSDPEGIPLTWSYEVTSGSLTNGGGVTATVSNVDNVFTITPSTTEDYAGSFSLTFKASDGVNIATAVSSFTLAFKIANSNYTTLLAKATALTQNSTFVDSSTNAHTVTVNGDVYQGTFSPYRGGGYSMYFDGSGDYLSINNDTSINLYSSNFTVEFWIYDTLPTGSQAEIIDHRTNTSPSGGWIIRRTTSNYLNFAFIGVAGVITTSTIPLRQWTHIAVTYSTTNTIASIYVNGVLDGQGSIGSMINTTAPITIGTGDGGTWSGNLSNIRIVKDIVYTSNFTPPTAPLTAITNTGLLINTPYIADSSTNAHEITVNGNTSTKPFGPFDYERYTPANGGSAYFGGTDYVSYTEPTIAVGQDFCFEFWINFTSAVAISNGEIRAFGSSPNDPLLYFSTDGTTISSVEFYMNNSSVFSLSNTFSLNTWYHIAVSRSSGEVSLFINGKLKGTNTNTNSIGGGTYFVGSHPTANWGITGYMSDYRSVIGSPVYTTDFTPPTAPLTAITNTSLLLNFTNAGIQDYSQVSDLKLLGNATGSNTQTKYAAYSVYFDGTGDSLNTYNNQIMNFSIGDFTIEAWIYPTNVTGVWCIYGHGTSGTAWSSWYIANGQLQWYDTGTAVDLLSAPGSIVANQWTHIAVVRNGTSFTQYINGVADIDTGTSSNATGSFATNINLGLGRWDGDVGYSYAGYIEDLRVTKGLARYTANFTPPTSELLG